jgi:hypothetical protein
LSLMSIGIGTGQPHTFRNKGQPKKRGCVEVSDFSC